MNWHDHDLRLTALAIAVLLTTLAWSTYLYVCSRQSLSEKSNTIGWINGALFGLGMWSAHFIAVISYHEAAQLSYSVPTTALSMLIAIVGGVYVSRISLVQHGRMRSLRIGLSQSAMLSGLYYVGLLGVNFNGTEQWNYGLIALSVVVCSTLTVTGVALRRRFGAVVGGAMLALAATLLHLLGMASLTLLPGGDSHSGGVSLSPLTFAIGLALILCATLLYVASAIYFLRSGRQQGVERQRQFGILAQGISDSAIFFLDPDGYVMTWNEGARRLKGYSETEAINLNFGVFHSAEDRAAGVPRKELDQALRDGRYAASGWRYRKDGTRFWAGISLEPLYGPDGKLKGFAKITRDLSELKQQREETLRVTRNLDLALSSMSHGLLLFDRHERILVKNSQSETLLGLAEGSLPIGMDLAEVVRTIGTQSGKARFDAERAEQHLRQIRQMLARPEAGSFTRELSESCVINFKHRKLEDGGWIVTSEDVTERYQDQKRIAHMARHDSLTDLPNRQSFSTKLAEGLTRLKNVKGDCSLIVAMIDLDGFKDINDNYGHLLGDRYLKRVAANIRGAVRPGEFVARIGGDEFAAFKFVACPEEAQQFVARLEGAVNRTVRVRPLKLTARGSVGWALAPRDGDQLSELIQAADLAMYAAKVSPDRTSSEFEPQMIENSRAERQISRDLALAVEKGQLSLVYQKQCNILTGRTTGYEALLRWRHPKLGDISPAVFIPIAERTGEVVRIGEWAIRQACTEATKLDQPVRVAVNISGVQLSQPGLARMVLGALVDTGLPACRLEIEVTETAIITNKERALHTLRQLKDMGVTIAVDDFGTGYSSLELLSSFPFDKLKIDRSFLDGVEGKRQARSIYRTILGLGESLRVKVLAEGVETKEQLAFLAAEGCEEAQGYYFGRSRSLGAEEEGGAQKDALDRSESDESERHVA